MKLFAIYIGGKTETSLIEVHDMRFVIAEKIEDAYDTLRAEWWGVPESLHLDCWGELTSADGHNISLKDYPAEYDEKLYFVNLGGYDPKKFTELHKDVFVVARNDSKAKVKALRQILDWVSHHRDYQFEVENCFCVNNIVGAKKLYIHLEKTDQVVPFEFTCKYLPIGKV